MYKPRLRELKSYWYDFKPVMASPCRGMSEDMSFRIASIVFPQATIASTMCIPKYAADREMRNGSSSNKTLAGPTIPVTITEHSCR